MATYINGKEVLIRPIISGYTEYIGSVSPIGSKYLIGKNSTALYYNVPTGSKHSSQVNAVEVISVDSTALTLNSIKQIFTGTLAANSANREITSATSVTLDFNVPSTGSYAFRNNGGSTNGINNSNYIFANCGGLAGQSTLKARIGGKIAGQTGTTSVGSSETDLATTTIGAYVVGNNAETLMFEYWGTLAANANSKRIRAYFGSTTVFDSTAQAANTGDWIVTLRGVRTGPTTIRWAATFKCDNILYTNIVDTSTSSDSLANSNTLRLTGLGVSDGDIDCRGYVGYWYPA